mmetsp:Transcript_7610/g.21151  ORF Transcript_7610/g.21151 Transcript_7610/m.21151 type:complete len:443 (+) Transcript_7610:181-1509(+)
MMKKKFRLVQICLVGAGVTILHIQLQLYFSLNYNHDQQEQQQQPHSIASGRTNNINVPTVAAFNNSTTTALSSTNHHHPNTTTTTSNCAINLYGLPRAFASIVLPSMITNIIRHNPTCDYFVHAYNLTQPEGAGRSGQGGTVHVHELLLLRKEVHAVNPQARVQVTWEPEADFWHRYGDLIRKIHTDPDPKDPTKRRFYPHRAKSYRFPMTVDNILKMWHSIESVWRLMMQYNLNQQYVRVAMLRSDVCYLTPIDVWSNGTDGILDKDNKVVIMPGFGRFPVSDRIIIGPYHAVEPWAIHRFDHLEDHASYMEANHSGWTLHSERFVRYTVLPQITSQQEQQFKIVEHSQMCFVRARADESLWMTDCFIGNPQPDILPHLYNFSTPNGGGIPPQHRSAVRATVESVLRRPCVPGTWSKPAKYGPHLALTCRRQTEEGDGEIQ